MNLYRNQGVVGQAFLTGFTSACIRPLFKTEQSLINHHSERRLPSAARGMCRIFEDNIAVGRRAKSLTVTIILTEGRRPGPIGLFALNLTKLNKKDLIRGPKKDRLLLITFTGDFVSFTHDGDSVSTFRGPTATDA